jgi:alpha-amylase
MNVRTEARPHPTALQRSVSVQLLSLLVAVGACCIGWASSARAQNVSAPAILQFFEAKWNTIENRMADVFDAGYGQLWLPPPQRADTGSFSAGYDVFDRFDLGRPRNETLYGTETSFRANVDAAHRASVQVQTDLVWNHNGFRSRTDSGFVAAGGYPGFALTLPGDVNGDYHDPALSYEVDEQNGSLFGLVDIAQEKNHQFIRHPTEIGNPNNIPAGTVYNRPDSLNARFYTDRDAPGLVLNDPALGATVTRYNFGAAGSLVGDPVLENATGLLMRNTQWMVQVMGVDGFRIDAARHMPTWVLNYFDQAVFRANPRLNLDGSIAPVFAYSEVADGNKGFVQSYVRQNLPNRNAIAPSNTTVGGNRDALDFSLFYALRSNLTGNGAVNNWHGIRGASLDLQDDGVRNGSQGVSFIDSHDEQQGFFPFLKNVAYAYTLMMPGQAVVYLNAKQFGQNRDFPNDGKDDALGGFYGETITRLVELRNSHGRGDFRERWIDDAFSPNGFSNIYVYERSKSAVVALNSRNDSFVETRNGVQTDFAVGTVLVELTGNAADGTVDPGNVIPEAIRVNGTGKVNLKIPSNGSHGRGYVIYGVAPPRGSLSLTGVASTMAGTTPTAANNGTARLADIDVITGNSFTVQLNTTPVTLPAPVGEANPVRDVHADGDTAMIRIDGGLNINGVAGIDNTSPGSVGYGFEEFVTQRAPGYIWNGSSNVGTGIGTYAQTIDTTQLSEGRHYVTVRAFRHRNAATGGDGGPAVFTDFRRTVYVDRLPAEAAIVSFAPFASSPGTLQNRDLIVRSVDGTADNMHFFIDLPAATTDAQILQMVQQGQGDAATYDRDSFISGYFNVRTGNHVATVVTIEPTGRTNVQRFPGLFTNTGVGAGFGDLNGNGLFQTVDLQNIGNGSFEDVLYSQGGKFNAAADVDGDGLVTNRDLIDLGPLLVSGGASSVALTSYDSVLVRRGDVNQDGQTNAADAATLYANFGPANWLMDLNVDGLIDQADITTLVEDLVRTSHGDFNLDRRVDGEDFLLWQRGVGSAPGRFQLGDANMNGIVDGNDLAIWRADYGLVAPLTGAVSSAVPEPTAAALLLVGALAMRSRRRSS